MVFSRSKGYADRVEKIPCGQCIGCRLERSRQWAMRCTQESKLYRDNCFVTLTYEDGHLPEHGSLVKEHLQKFMKRLRKRFGQGIRFFGCGEYGEKYGRPHYHICIFNFDFEDRKFLRDHKGTKYYTSKALSELWPFGHSVIGDVTFESAAYVARYVTKKVTGALAVDHYGPVLPEFTLMSRRPGIGLGHFEKHLKQIYPSDFVVLRGMRMRPPKYYDSKYELTYPSDMGKVKAKRRHKSFLGRDGHTQERLRAKEVVQMAKLKLKRRGLE